MTLVNKIKWGVAVVFVFLLILATNLIDKNNFIRIEESVEKIYQEQLVTKDAILELSNRVHEKELAVILGDTNYFRNKAESANARIKELVDQCMHEGVDVNSERIITDLSDNMSDLFKMEAVDSLIFAVDKTELRAKLGAVKSDIAALAEIQMEEGKRQKLSSRDALDSSNLFSQIEMYFLIIIAIGVQVIILYPSRSVEVEED